MQRHLLQKEAGTSATSSQDIIVDLNREKDYAWILERLKREFQHKKKTVMPHRLKPMLASSIAEPFNDEAWQFEIKWDGYRALAYRENGKVDLRSRNNLSFCHKFPELAEEIRRWPVNAVVDGEIVILSPEGKADFGALQAWQDAPQGELLFFAFDLLWIAGIDLRKEPLHIRRDVLRRVIPDSGAIRFSDSIDAYGKDFFKVAKENGLEGIIAKQKDAPYEEGKRSRSWYKIKAEKRQEAVICGYAKNKDTDRLFSSLVLGIPTENGFTYIGQAGSGFSTKLQADLLRKMTPLLTRDCPFPTKPKIPAAVQWVRPSLLCEVNFTEMTRDGLMRHPVFLGLRPDKSVAQYNAEDSHDPPLPSNYLATEKIITGKASTLSVDVEGKALHLTNLGKLYWPKNRISKGDLLNYYHQVSGYMLPYMLGRPQSLNRFPNGIDGKSFYQKNMKGKVEAWLSTFERSSSDGEEKDFLVCTGEASLLYMANLGCIEMNPWHSRVQTPHHPDWCVIDLDPGDISFEKVIETALVIRTLLQSLGIPSYPKTSGSTGLHIYIPLGAKYGYEQSRQLAELLVTLVHAELPKTTSLERSPQKRKDKTYLDFLQNRPIQTICAPYSVRPRPDATVSAPLHWEEVKKGLRIKQFTMATMAARLKREGDLFTGVLGKGIELNDVLRKLSALL
ncbi:DNA ligase D [Flavisolibacter sp. BT320]|nr:DNA ligase D [Flavisolibacter longurius]